MLAEISNGDIWAAVITVAGSILLGGLAMAWRLGALSQKVSDTQTDVAEVKDDVKAVKTAQATMQLQVSNVRGQVAALRGQIAAQDH